MACCLYTAIDCKACEWKSLEIVHVTLNYQHVNSTFSPQAGAGGGKSTKPSLDRK